MRKFQTITTFMLMLLLLASCGKEESSLEEQYIVTFNEAKKVATSFIENLNSSSPPTQQRQAIKFTASKTYFTAIQQEAAHIFNVENNGKANFVIISGDKRVAPILAYGDQGDFNFEYLPFGVADWLDKTIKNTAKIRKEKRDQSKFVAALWTNPNELSRADPVEDPYQNDPCGTTQLATYGPLMTTAWGQDCPYNLLMPENNCEASLCEEGRPPTGCVATSAAQLMRYHEQPAGYNYSIMPNLIFASDSDTPGALEISQLVFDVGAAVNMNWDCDGSGADTELLPEALESEFGYANGGTYSNYNSESTKQSLRWGNPVLLSACTDGLGLFDWNYNDCHTWVCDGYKRYWDNCNGYLYYHMNWGWDHSFNGWYAFNSWEFYDNGSYVDHAYDKDQIINIQP